MSKLVSRALSQVKSHIVPYPNFGPENFSNQIIHFRFSSWPCLLVIRLSTYIGCLDIATIDHSITLRFYLPHKTPFTPRSSLSLMWSFTFHCRVPNPHSLLMNLYAKYRHYIHSIIRIHFSFIRDSKIP